MQDDYRIPKLITKLKNRIDYKTSNIWNGISSSDIDSFISNFDDKLIGYMLLDLMIYYSDEQETVLIKSLLSEFDRLLWLNASEDCSFKDSETITDYLKEEYEHVLFVPVSDQDPSDSSFALTASFKRVLRDQSKSFNCAGYKDIPLAINQKFRRIVFYDDLIGTGNQFLTFLNNSQLGTDLNYKLIDVIDNANNIDFYFMTFGACKDGFKAISDNGISVITAELIDDSYNILDCNNDYWRLINDKTLYERFASNSFQIEKDLESRSSFTKDISILFQHGRSSNTAFSLYWTDKKNWHPICIR